MLIDAGVSAKRIRSALEQIGQTLSTVAAVLITHEHTDHVAGAAQIGRLGVPLYMNSATYDVLREKWGNKIQGVRIFQNGELFNVGPAQVLPIPVAHDAYDPVAFRISLGGISIGFATDIGYPSQLVIERLRGCDVLLLESNHDLQMLQADVKRPWSVKQRILSRHGHLSNEAAAELARELVTRDTKQLVLGHLSGDCNTTEAVRRAFERVFQISESLLKITILDPRLEEWRHIPCTPERGNDLV